MSGSADVNYQHLRDLIHPADIILDQGLVALSKEASEVLRQRWQELEANWKAYKVEFIGKLKPDVDKEFRSNVTLARLFIALSLQEKGQTLLGITDLFTAQEIYRGRLLAGTQFIDAHTTSELIKQVLDNSQVRESLDTLLKQIQEELAELLEPRVNISNDLLIALKNTYTKRFEKLKEVARLTHSQFGGKKVQQGDPPTRETPPTLQTQKVPGTHPHSVTPINKPELSSNRFNGLINFIVKIKINRLNIIVCCAIDSTIVHNVQAILKPCHAIGSVLPKSFPPFLSPPCPLPGINFISVLGTPGPLPGNKFIPMSCPVGLMVPLVS